MGAVFEGQCRYVQDPLKTDGGIAPAGQLAAPTMAAADHDQVMSGVVVTSAS
jgi:hypothetical protein